MTVTALVVLEHCVQMPLVPTRLGLSRTSVMHFQICSWLMLHCSHKSLPHIYFLPLPYPSHPPDPPHHQNKSCSVHLTAHIAGTIPLRITGPLAYSLPPVPGHDLGQQSSFFTLICTYHGPVKDMNLARDAFRSRRAVWKNNDLLSSRSRKWLVVALTPWDSSRIRRLSKTSHTIPEILCMCRSRMTNAVSGTVRHLLVPRGWILCPLLWSTNYQQRITCNAFQS
ncbi:hypothetical protein BJ875DRAFT_458839 [Amylocarpus encephaloides]|uniref:Uncharacterized protein n=1 Tax=Amylocarpus encephaloides TaxID=45428 RepID=A0A9P8C6Q8_9HELO|nr:hypothetical protein BJ875DRAFT_458839 [Amylocarpus encephaloides]